MGLRSDLPERSSRRRLAVNSNLLSGISRQSLSLNYLQDRLLTFVPTDADASDVEFSVPYAERFIAEKPHGAAADTPRASVRTRLRLCVMSEEVYIWIEIFEVLSARRDLRPHYLAENDPKSRIGDPGDVRWKAHYDCLLTFRRRPAALRQVEKSGRRLLSKIAVHLYRRQVELLVDDYSTQLKLLVNALPSEQVWPSNMSICLQS